MPLAQEETNKSVEQNRIRGKKKDIEPNLIYAKYSIYNQREEDGLFRKLEREDKENIAKASGTRTYMVRLLEQEIPMIGEEE